MDILELINKIEIFYQNFGYLTAFFGTLIEMTPLGWVVPGGTILILGGVFAFGGKISLVGIIISGWLGAWISFVTSYILGFKSGMWLVKKFKQEKNAALAKHLLDKHGGKILTTSMLANLTRFWMAYIAGTEKYNLPKFLFYSGAASLTWTSLMVIVGFMVGTERKNLEGWTAGLGIFSWALLLVAIGFIIWSIKKEYKKITGINSENESY
ncbi:MAG: VTT domain-containing protein [bacterium]|nr:VTT domain-containing protein [bacterium]